MTRMKHMPTLKYFWKNIMGRMRDWMIEMEDLLDEYLEKEPLDHSYDKAILYIKENIIPVDKNYILKLYQNKTIDIKPSS